MFEGELIPGWKVSKAPFQSDIYDVAHDCPVFGHLILFKAHKEWSGTLKCDCGSELPHNIIATLCLIEK